MAEAPTLIPGTHDEADICLELLRLESVYPLWETWIHVNKLLYARRTQTSPPLVVKADNTALLWEQVRGEEGRIAAKRTGQAPGQS